MFEKIHLKKLIQIPKHHPKLLQTFRCQIGCHLCSFYDFSQLDNIMFFKKLINKGYEADHCEICNSTFKLIKFDRIHKCKRCLKFICQSCGDSKEFVIGEDGKMTAEKHRVCINCKADIQLIRQNMERFCLQWAHDSSLARQWLTNLRKQHRQDYEYGHFLTLFFRSGEKFHQETEIIEKDVIRGRTDFSVFNYSMKEFFYTVQLGVEDQHSTRLNIANVLYAVAARFQKIGYCQGMSGIAAFLLCFASQETAFIIFCDLLQHVFPPMFFERNAFGVSLVGLLAEIHFLKQYYQQVLIKGKRALLLKEREKYSEEEVAHMKVVIELAGSKALLSVFIGVLSFSNLMFVWEELTQHRAFEVVERAFLAILYLNRNAILQERSFKKLQEYFQKLDGEAFREAYHDIHIDPTRRQTLIQEFYLQNNTKWSASAGTPYTLSKITNLTEPQIRAIEKMFCQGYTQQQIAQKAVIDQEGFVALVGAYYRVLKQERDEGDSILEISAYFLRKIFRSYLGTTYQGLLFRELVCCFSICTKGSLKERVIAILSTFRDNSSHVSIDNFNKLVLPLLELAPPPLQLKKNCFLERANKFFAPQDSLPLHQLEILLNDEFMLELSLLIAFEAKDIVKKTLDLFQQERAEREAAELKQKEIPPKIPSIEENPLSGVVSNEVYEKTNQS